MVLARRSAEVFGATGRTIWTPDEIAPVLKEALDHTTSLIEIGITR